MSTSIKTDALPALRSGAVGLIDVLGFKGMWRRHSHNDIMARTRTIQEESSKAASAIGGGTAHVGITFKRAGRLVMSIQSHFTMLSDTIVIAYSLDPCKLVGYQVTVQMLARLVGRLTEIGVGGTPAMAFRGCIAAGDFIIDGNMILGGAIDDAATHMDLAEAAITWLAPSAKAKLDAVPHDELSQTLVPHRVPLKGGSTYATLVARPTTGFASTGEADVCARVLATIPTDRVDLAIKHQNTGDFFRVSSTVPRNPDFYLPALRVRGTQLRGGIESIGTGAEPLPVLMEDGSPYTGDDV